MFRNVNGKYFEELTMNGFGHLQKGHGIAFGDIDSDGDQDIYCVMGGAFEGDNAKNVLFENPNNKNNWITINVQGKTVNRSAHGSKIKVNVVDAYGAKRSIYNTISSGATFGANSIQSEIGLGKARSIESIEIIWAREGLKPAVYKNIPMNSFVKLTEGNSRVEVLNRKAVKLAQKSESQQHHQH
jgi:hypothetical protein